MIFLRFLHKVKHFGTATKPFSQQHIVFATYILYTKIIFPPVWHTKLYKKAMINSVVIEWKNVCPMNYQSSFQFILNFMKRKQTPKKRSKKHDLFFGPKWDDYWFIERLWAIYSQRVYRNPQPTNIAAVMRRLRDEVRNTNPDTLVRLCHELPAKMNEIYRLKRKKIPSNFDPR